MIEMLWRAACFAVAAFWLFVIWRSIVEGVVRGFSGAPERREHRIRFWFLIMVYGAVAAAFATRGAAYW